MAGNYTGRGNNAGPATEFFPLSGASASSPAVTITGTSAAGQTTVHTGDANAQDVLFVTMSNFGASSITAYSNLGSTATTGTVQTTLVAGANSVVFNGNAAISKAGVYGVWTSATTLAVFGYIARTYTATG